MNFLKSISNHKLIAFITGTIVLQIGLISVTAYYRSKHFSLTPPAPTSRESHREIAKQIQPKIERPAVAENAPVERNTTSEQLPATKPLESKAVEAPVVKKAEEAPSTTQNQSASRIANAKVVSYKIAPGDTLTKIWVKNGASVAGSLKAADAFRKASVPLNTLRLNEELKLSLSSDNDIVRLEKKLPHGKTLILTGDAKAGYETQIDEENTTTRERTVSYPIYGSFSASAHEVAIPSEIIDDLVDLFSGRLDFRRDLQPGDSFSVIYTEHLGSDGRLLEAGPIKAISIETGGKLLAAVGYVGKDGTTRFYDENGEQIGDYFLRYPLKFTRISSIFTEARFHPILGVNRPHNGVDFSAPTGTPVRSIGEGVVEVAQNSGDSGNMIRIRHNEKYSTAYLHLSKFAAGMKAGTRVSRGEIIGAVGSTGLATGPHLHFALFENGKFVNPLTVKLPAIGNKNDSIPKLVLASTMKVLREQHTLVRFASLIGVTKESKV